MKTTIVIPTYWRGPESEAPMCTLESDFLYDHATPLDHDGTLSRALASLSILNAEEGFAVAVVAAPTRIEIKQAVQLKVQSIVAQFDYDFPMMLIGPDELVFWRRRLAASGMSEYDQFFSLEGYSNIRNMCLLAAALTGADVAILFDDDQIYEDPDYLKKATEFIGQEHENRSVSGIAGYYVNQDDSYLLPPAELEWQRKWGNREAMNEAFGIIGQGPRLKPTPFVFGGNMVIHRSLFEKIPFDPTVPRGEDIDYLMNARFFGHEFLLDNELWIRHLPPPKCSPPWFQIRQDIIRFARERAKLATQHNNWVHRITSEDFDPYPGCFLRDDFHDRVMDTSLEMASEYMEAGMEQDAAECMVNIAISKAEAHLKGDPFGDFLTFQKSWEEFMRVLPNIGIWSAVDGSD
ncbi:MAG: hypothetical protein Q7K29_01520 [Thermoleophilia bacterium]|nr:hypothetical protein [Thermoleophilia bacterium]